MSFKTVSLIAFAVALTLLLTEAGQLSTQALSTLTAQAETPVPAHTDAPSVTPTSQPATTSSLSAASPAPSATHTPTQTKLSTTQASTSSATQAAIPTQAATWLATPPAATTLLAKLTATETAPTLQATARATTPLKLAVTGTMGTNNWYTSSVTVKAVNPSSPVEFSLDGGPFLLASSIQIASDGKHQVVARPAPVGYADGEGHAVSLEVNVDQTPPVFDETHTDTQEGVHVDSLSGHDDVSGLAQAYVDGNRIVLIDKAGNRAERVVAP